MWTAATETPPPVGRWGPIRRGRSFVCRMQLQLCRGTCFMKRCLICRSRGCNMSIRPLMCISLVMKHSHTALAIIVHPHFRSTALQSRRCSCSTGQCVVCSAQPARFARDSGQHQWGHGTGRGLSRLPNAFGAAKRSRARSKKPRLCRSGVLERWRTHRILKCNISEGLHRCCTFQCLQLHAAIHTRGKPAVHGCYLLLPALPSRCCARLCGRYRLAGSRGAGRGAQQPSAGRGPGRGGQQPQPGRHRHVGCLGQRCSHQQHGQL